MYKRNREMNFKIVILRTHSKQDIDFCLNYSTVRLETAPKSNLPYEKENAFQKDQKLRISITNEDILKILYPRNPRRVSASSIKWFQTNVDCFRFTCKTDFLSVKYEASVN